MKNVILLAFLLPLFAAAQTKPKTKKIVAAEAKPADGFIINGNVTGFPDGTIVDIMNGQSGAQEAETTIQGNKFTIKGKLAVTPDFKVLLFNKQQPYVTLFLDNSIVKISGAKDAFDKLVITGSPTETDFDKLSKALLPYQAIFMDGAPYDSLASAKATAITKDFAASHPNSFVATIAIIRYLQINDDDQTSEALYNALAPQIRSSAYGTYIAQQINLSKTNAFGTVLSDFTQADTAGNPVSLSSFRGKYLLVDFWASWCHPCRMENPNVVAAYHKFKNKNFTVLSVSLDKSKQAWIDAIKMDGLDWTHVSDLQGWSNAVALQFQINNIPQNILLDPQGRIIGKNLRGEALERKLNRVLNK